MLNPPFHDLARPVRAVETMTASDMRLSLKWVVCPASVSQLSTVVRKIIMEQKGMAQGHKFVSLA
jgi:hypothetical protein